MLSTAPDYRVTLGARPGPEGEARGRRPRSGPEGRSQLPRDPSAARGRGRLRARPALRASPTAPRWASAPSRGRPPAPRPPTLRDRSLPRQPRNHPDNAPSTGRIRLRLPGASLPPGVWPRRAGARGGPEASSVPGRSGGRRLQRWTGGGVSTCSLRRVETVGGRWLRGEGRRPRGPTREAGAQERAVWRMPAFPTIRTPPWAYPRKEEAVHSDLTRTLEQWKESWT